MFPQIVAALPEIELAGGLAQRVETIGWSLKVIAALQLIFFLGGYIFVRALQPYGGDFKALPTNRQGFYGLLALLVLVASVIGPFWTLWVSIRTLFPYFIAVFPAIFEDSFRSSLRAQITIVPLISNSLFPVFLVVSAVFAHYSYRVVGEPILRERFNAELQGNERFQAVMNIGSRLGLQAAIFWSYILTIGAMSAGLLVSEDVIATPRLYLSNFVFDAATLLATIYALSLLRKAPNFLTLIIIIAVDAFFAFVFALASVFIGLSGSEAAISLGQALQMFWFHQPSDLVIDATPYIWAMHTAFLPTIFLWISILAIILGKISLMVTKWWVLKRVDSKELPIEQTATAISVLGGFLLTIANQPWQFLSG